MANKAKHSKKNPPNIMWICLIIFIISTVYLVCIFINKKNDKNKITKLQEYNPQNIQENNNSNKTEKMIKVAELQNQNSDVKGWIEINNTKINYPILQTTDNEYYLTHDNTKGYNKYGSIFIKNECDINDANSNLIIYGHNMKDEEMFNTLLKYQEKKYYEEHKAINITTENEERQYEIIAAFKSRVFYKDEKNVFRYYNILKFTGENEFNDYISNVKKIQLYDTGITANYGEQLLTLITCEYSQENGRMVVVAKYHK